jgi:hypothetical protein
MMLSGSIAFLIARMTLTASPWLTKIIVGVSLVNVQTAYQYFVVAAKTLGAGLEGSGNLTRQPRLSLLA